MKINKENQSSPLHTCVTSLNDKLFKLSKLYYCYTLNVQVNLSEYKETEVATEEATIVTPSVKGNQLHTVVVVSLNNKLYLLMYMFNLVFMLMDVLDINVFYRTFVQYFYIHANI